MRAFTLTLACCPFAVGACDVHTLQTASDAPPGVSQGGAGGTGGTAGTAGATGRGGSGQAASGGVAGTGGAGTVCPKSLVARRTTTDLTTSVPVRYARLDYDLRQGDERLALAPDGTGKALIGWLAADRSTLFVTPLGADGRRAGADVAVAGLELGGLVPTADGFALLTRRTDPGELLVDPNGTEGDAQQAAYFVRWANGAERVAVPLTGTLGVRGGTPARVRDCTPTPLRGRLARSGERFGAYFSVHGCEGSEWASYYWDKLVLVDQAGAALSGGWDYGCAQSTSRVVATPPGTFLTVCTATGTPYAGVVQLDDDAPARLLAAEYAVPGYVAAELGAAVPTSDGGAVLVFTSRHGVNAATGRPATRTRDPAWLRVDATGAPVGPIRYLAETDTIDELHVRAAPYGAGRFLLTWERITNVRCSAATCFGDNGGAVIGLFDADGNALGPLESLPDPPHGDDELQVYPGGDVAWLTVVGGQRDWSKPLAKDAQGQPVVPEANQLRWSRLRRCQ